MKYPSKLLIIIFFSWAPLSAVDALSLSGEFLSFELPVVDHVSSKKLACWVVHSHAPLRMYDVRRKKWGVVREKSVVISFDETGLLINNTHTNISQVCISNSQGYLWVNGVRYSSLVSFEKHNKGAVFVAFARKKDQWQKDILQALIDDAGFERKPRGVLSDEVHRQELIEQLDEVLHEEKSTRTSLSEKIIHIRVLLESTKESCTWRLTAPQGFIITDSSWSDKKYARTASTVDVTSKNGSFWIGSIKSTKKAFTLKPVGGPASYKGRMYDGDLIVHYQDGIAYLINLLNIEDYVFSVLKTESWPGWPLEVNKVFAIASRTYALATAIRARKNNQPYDIKSTKEHQTYSGIHNCSVIKSAVQETAGLCVCYENEPIVAMFDCCCGGVITAHMEGPNFASAPYLARKYACQHCKRCRIYSWQTQCHLNDFSSRVFKRYKKLAKVKRVKVTKRDKAGLVREVLLKGLEGQMLLSGQEFYSLMAEVKSFYFNLRQKGNTLIFDKARGYGHHLGLCQWGAREMVRDGWNYKRILEFYYPGTTFMKVT